MLELHRIVGPPAQAPPGSEELYVGTRSRDAGAGSTAGIRVERDSLVVTRGRTVSLDTYMNGFPIAYWRAAGSLRSVILRAQISGHGVVRVQSKRADGSIQPRLDHPVEAVEGLLFEIEVPIGDGDEWWWLEIAAGASDLVIAGAGWWAPVSTRPRLGVAITTFDRPADCAALLLALASEAGPIEHIVVVDQGTDTVAAHANFSRAQGALAGRLQYVTQPNLGGSGGFARGISEVMRRSELTHVLLLDDDVVLDPEAVRRLASFAAVAGEVIVGGQMLELTRPTVLHSTGEVVDRSRFWWGPAPGAATGVEMAGAPLSTFPAISRPVEVDFNGWWMCLIPLPTVRRLGLPLPLFIKWDDVEYGLRAQRAGVDTVTLPGAGLWHMPWTGKDASRDWQAFFLTRNRLVVAVLNRSSPALGLLLHLLAHAVLHLVTMAYSSADMVANGVEDFLDGPDRLVPSMVAGPPPLQSRRRGFVDGRSVARDPSSRTRVVASTDRWRLARLNRAFVSDAGAQTGVQTGALRQRDHRLALALAWRLVISLARVGSRWRRLRKQYMPAATRLSSPAGWQQVWDETHP